MKLYDIRAKRKGADEPWTEWTRVKDFKSALKHEQRIKELGYDAKIVEVIYPIELLREFAGRLKEQFTSDEYTAFFYEDITFEVIDMTLKEFEKKTDIYGRVRKNT